MFESYQEGNAVYVTNPLKKRWLIEGEELVLTIREARALIDALMEHTYKIQSDVEEAEDA